MQNFLNLVTANMEGIILGIIVFLIILLIWLISVNLKLNRNVKHYHSLMRGMRDKNLEEILNEHINSVKLAIDRVNEVELLNKRHENILRKCFQKMAVVRFNAFDNTGSDLSFAIALLDKNGDGVVLSSIYGRDESRSYAKPITNGQSKYHLSTEEIDAVNKALQQTAE
jgi:hypothetical protein